MALKLKGSTSGFVAIDAPSVAGNNTLTLPENNGSAHQILANDITAGVTTFTSVTVNRNGDLTVPGTISIGGTLTYEDVTSVDSVGIVTARGLSIFGNTTGLNVTSGISTFTGDIFLNSTDKKIYLSSDSDQYITANAASNYIAFAAGNAEKVRIASNGSVGIGTDHLSGNASTYHKLVVEGDTTSTIAVAKIVRKNASASNSTYTFEVDSSTHTSNMSSGGAMSVDVYAGRAFTIDGNGRIGIGTETPDSILALEGTGSDNATRITIKDGTGIAEVNGRYGNLILDADRDNAVNGSVMTFQIDNDEKVRIDSSGRVLIGHNATQTIGSNSHGLSQINVTANQPVLTLARFENVAAGPSLVLGKSRASSAGSYTVVQANDGLGNISFAGADGTDLVTVGANISAEVDGTPGSNDLPGRLVFATTADGASSPTERMRINNLGNVSIGGIAPVATTTAYNGASLHLHNTTSGSNYGSQIHLTSAHTGSAAGDGTQLSVYSTDLYINNQENGNTHFYNNGSPTATIKANGNFGINTQSPTDKLHVNGTALISSNLYCNNNVYLAANKGIYFDGGTGTANHMDDYEEGQWTPTVKFGSTSATVTSNGKYTKVGNLVNITYQVTIDNLNSGTGSISVESLPFAVSQSPTYSHGIVQGNSSKNLPSSAGSTMPYIQSGGTTFRILYDTPTAHGDVNQNQFPAGVTFYGMGQYFTST